MNEFGARGTLLGFAMNLQISGPGAKYFNVLRGELKVGECYPVAITYANLLFGIIPGIFLTTQKYLGEVNGFNLFGIRDGSVYKVNEFLTGSLVQKSIISEEHAYEKAVQMLTENKNVEMAKKRISKQTENYFANILEKDVPEELKKVLQERDLKKGARKRIYLKRMYKNGGIK